MSANGNTIPPYVFEQKGTFGAPFTFDVPGSLEVRPDTATARFDGTNASGPFLACLTFYGTDGERLGRWFNPTPVPKGSVAEVTYTPPFGSAAASAATGSNVETTNVGGSVTVNPTTELLIGAGLALANPSTGVAEVTGNAVVTSTQFNPVAGDVTVSSTNPDVPDVVVTASAIVVDGSTQYRIEFGAAAMDCDQRGINNTGALLLELWRDSSPIGIIGELAVMNETYAAVSCYLVAYDTPPAGDPVYSLRGYVQGGSGGSVGPSHVAGANISTPHVTHPGYFAIFFA